VSECPSKKAVVLCGGPSLFSTWGRPGLADRRDYDWVLGVNRVAAWFPLDYWIALDWQLGELVAPITAPTFVMSPDAWRTLSQKVPDLVRDRMHLDHFTIALPRESPAEWSVYSFPTAIATAWHLGAKVIDCFGVDWNGKRDADGWNEATDRTAARWAREQAIVRATVRLLADRGTVVRRATMETL
jgi:hypothetical protein